MDTQKRSTAMATPKKRVVKKPKCENLVALFDRIEVVHQALFEDIQRALKIRNNEEGVRKILREMKEKLI